jgi:hypothetical protein
MAARRCGAVPAKSKWMLEPRTVTFTCMRIGSGTTPSSSRKSWNSYVPSGMRSMTDRVMRSA